MEVQMIETQKLVTMAAPYNPRTISDHDLSALGRSMTTFGVVGRGEPCGAGLQAATATAHASNALTRTMRATATTSPERSSGGAGGLWPAARGGRRVVFGRGTFLDGLAM